jgi:hypothetical protein
MSASKARGIIEARKGDYRQCFGSPAGQRVMEDLAQFCRINTMNESAYAPGDTNETMMRLGCQQVFRHICMHLGLTIEQLVGIYVPGGKLKIGETND